jgi:hypothetical protein
MKELKESLSSKDNFSASFAFPMTNFLSIVINSFTLLTSFVCTHIEGTHIEGEGNNFSVNFLLNEFPANVLCYPV